MPNLSEFRIFDLNEAKAQSLAAEFADRWHTRVVDNVEKAIAGADIIATIYRFCSNRDCLAHIRYVDIEAKHGVRESVGFSSIGVEVDKVIYATRTAFADLPHNEEPSEQEIKASWTATVDLFPTLQIGP